MPYVINDGRQWRTEEEWAEYEKACKAEFRAILEKAYERGYYDGGHPLNIFGMADILKENGL